MPTLPNWFCQLIQLVQTVLMIAAQVMHRMRLRLRSRAALAAETLFLKKQFALYQEPMPDGVEHARILEGERAGVLCPDKDRVTHIECVLLPF
jgi:hypothetical protein